VEVRNKGAAHAAKLLCGITILPTQKGGRTAFVWIYTNNTSTFDTFFFF